MKVWDDIKNVVASIHKGSQGTQQALGQWAGIRNNGSPERCVMEAAIYGKTGKSTATNYEETPEDIFGREFPEASKVTAKCPACIERYIREGFVSTKEMAIENTSTRRLLDLGVHLNDRHEWTREHIAEYFLTLADEIYQAAPESKLAQPRQLQFEMIAEEARKGKFAKAQRKKARKKAEKLAAKSKTIPIPANFFESIPPAIPAEKIVVEEKILEYVKAY